MLGLEEEKVTRMQKNGPLFLASVLEISLVGKNGLV